LIRATWGDCYCSSPDYRPQVGDDPIDNFTTMQIFAFMALPSTVAAQSQCRDFLALPDSKSKWQCNSTRAHNANTHMRVKKAEIAH
jgi:hypothetical protein